MIDLLMLRTVQTVEHIRMHGLASFFKEYVYRDRKAIVFQKDLRDAKDAGPLLRQCGAELVEIDRDDVERKRYIYRFRNRYLKALHYLKQGYSGYGVVKGREIVGEMWYCPAGGAGGGKAHPDLAWLGITLAGNEVYAFDWFVVPGERGNNLAGPFQRTALHALSRKKYARAFAYVWADNTPALWTTRSVNKWKEVKTERMTRLLVSRTH